MNDPKIVHVLIAAIFTLLGAAISSIVTWYSTKRQIRVKKSTHFYVKQMDAYDTLIRAITSFLAKAPIAEAIDIDVKSEFWYAYSGVAHYIDEETREQMSDLGAYLVSFHDDGSKSELAKKLVAIEETTTSNFRRKFDV